MKQTIACMIGAIMLVVSMIMWVDYCSRKNINKEMATSPITIPIETSNNYEIAELQKKVTYYKTEYESMKYSYDKLAAALGNWRGVMSEWLEQTNEYYRRK